MSCCWSSMCIISKISKRVIVTFMLDEEPFSRTFAAYNIGGKLYVFVSIFNKIPALQKEENSQRNNIIKIYAPPDLSVTMTHFIHLQTVQTHYILKNWLNQNKNILPLPHMHPRSHEFITKKLSDELKIWWPKLNR